MMAMVLLASAAFTQADGGGSTRRVVVKVRPHLHLGPISPYIYGTNDDRPQAWTASKRHSFGRLGGNRWTAYNWENNASNAGKDWHHQNDNHLSPSDEPAKAVTDRLEVIQRYGAPALVTVPMQGWVAADKNADGDVNKSGEQYLSKRFLQNVASNPVGPRAIPNVFDRIVHQDQFVAHLERWRQRRQSPPIWFSLDNEPDLWHDTHPRIQPKPLNEKEFIARSIEFARAIKAEAPDALLFGPAVSGWMGMVRVGDEKYVRGFDFLERYMDAFLSERKKSNSLPLLDVLDVHWYPEHRGGGERITSDSSKPEVARQRVEAPRSLNDPTFIEDSWITKDVKSGPINLIPQLKSLIAKVSPGTKLAITEYYFGGGGDPSGAVAQADVLGIFGKEGVFAANLFHIGKTDDRWINAAFDLYRNYDGRGSSFGDTVVETDNWSPALVSVYAAAAKPEITVVLVNKREGPTRVDLQIVDSPTKTALRRFQVAAPTPKPVPVDDLRLEFLLLPPMSATMVVIQK
jgi:hypothetical protein